MKYILFTIITILFLQNVKAQNTANITQKTTTIGVLQNVVDQLNSSNLINNEVLIQKNAVADKFKSNICMNNGDECTVTKYANQNVRGTYGTIVWQTKSNINYNFNDAKVQYEKLYSELNLSTFYYKTVPYKINAIYNEPSSQVNYATSLFEFGGNKRMNIFLQLIKENENWKIQIDVFERYRITD